MDTEGGAGSMATPLPEHGKKRPPPSPPTTPDDDEDSSKSSINDDNGEWLVSDSEEDEDDHDNDKGTYQPYTVDDITRVSCDPEEQSKILYATPRAELRGPSPIRLLPAFKCANHIFAKNYNLSDRSEIKVRNVGDCPDECRCYPMHLLQFINIQIAGYQHNRPGCAKIHGFVAARESAEPLRNYVYKREIENSEAVSVKRKRGVARLSLRSPARVISMPTRALIEFELRAQNEDKIDGDDDLIIEGCTEIDNLFKSKSSIEHKRLYGERCALDIKYAVLFNAMEAQVSLEVLRVPTHGVDLKLYAKTSGFSYVIRLFRGVALEVGLKKSFVVGVEMYNYLDLYIEGFPLHDPVLGRKLRPSSWWQCSFSSSYHGTVELVAELGDFAAVSVKVTWKWFMGDNEKQPMEIEGGGSGSAEIFDLTRGKKRPASPSTSATSDEGDEWLLSDSGSEEDEENQETHRPFTVADFPRVTSDHEQQTNLLYKNPETKLRGPRAVRLFNPLKTGKLGFTADYNITDQSEISVRDVGDCSNECRCLPMDLLQFVSANIAGYRHTSCGPAKIFGFVAARDTIMPLRNYGLARLSLISPARVISFSTRVLIEFELHAWSDEETDGDNGSIIEGCTELYNMHATESFVKQNRVYGERCALDIKYLVLINALEACIEVKILSLGATPGGIDLKLCAKSSGFKEVIRLFQGAAPDPGETMSFIVAAEKRKGFDLYIEGSARDDQKLLPLSWTRSFMPGYHAMNENVAKLGEFATVSVKVTWRTHMKKALRGHVVAMVMPSIFRKL
ncbi:hypothetical protein EJB05_00890, partial [Eragrostis curvula]